MSLKTRLARVEQVVGTIVRRCERCADWPETQVTYVNDWTHDGADPPRRCSGCGWEPAIISVVYDDDWGSQRTRE